MPRKSFAFIAAASTLVAALASQTVAAQSSGWSGNFMVTSDYRFRGLSQTFRQLAIQGGIDWTSPAGFYLGNWNSSLSGVQYPDTVGVEMDVYAGYRFQIGAGIDLDLGALYYYYPGSTGFNNSEVYLGISRGPFSLKTSYNVSDFFGLPNSKGSYYVDLGMEVEIFDQTTLVVHLGYQDVRRNSGLNYTDYKVGITRAVGSWEWGLAVIGTDADKGLYTATSSTGKTRLIGEPGMVLSIGKSF